MSQKAIQDALDDLARQIVACCRRHPCLGSINVNIAYDMHLVAAEHAYNSPNTMWIEAGGVIPATNVSFAMLYPMAQVVISNLSVWHAMMTSTFQTMAEGLEQKASELKRLDFATTRVRLVNGGYRPPKIVDNPEVEDWDARIETKETAERIRNAGPTVGLDTGQQQSDPPAEETEEAT